MVELETLEEMEPKVKKVNQERTAQQTSLGSRVNQENQELQVNF